MLVVEVKDIIKGGTSDHSFYIFVLVDNFNFILLLGLELGFFYCLQAKGYNIQHQWWHHHHSNDFGCFTCCLLFSSITPKIDFKKRRYTLTNFVVSST